MKKMTKGAIVTGLGVALLLGGGGTLAVWNDSVESTAGTIASGNLALSAKDGVWTDSAGDKIEKIGKYGVVPGEKLTYTQVVKPTLDGDKLEATLEVSGVEEIMAHNDSKLISVTEPVLTNSDGDVLPTVLTEADNNKPVTVSTTFAFSIDATDDEYKKHEWDFSSIGYFLEQQDPTAPTT